MNVSLIKHNAENCCNHRLMKNLTGLSFAAMLMVGCRESTVNDIINTAVVNFAGVFITESVKSGPVLRIEGRPEVKKETDSTFYVSGLVEEFSPLNYPVGVKHFNETLFYSGGNPNKRESWKCIELYIGDKK